MASKKKAWLDVRALVQALAAFAICGLLAWCGSSIKSTLVDVKSTIDKHSTAVEQIPEIKKNVDLANQSISYVNQKIDAKSGELSNKIDEKTKDLIGRNEFSVRTDKINNSLDTISRDQQQTKVDLAKQQAKEDAIRELQQRQPPK